MLTSLVLGSSYKIQVSSSNEVGESQKSESVTILFANAPSQPASLSLAPGLPLIKSEPHIVATWSAPVSVNGDAVRGYKLYIDNGEGSDYSLVYDGTGFANVYTYTVTSMLSCGTLYNLKVTAVNLAGESLPAMA